MKTAVKFSFYVMVENESGIDRKEVSKIIEEFFLPDLEKVMVTFGNQSKLTKVEIEQIQKVIGPFKWKILSHEQFMSSLDNLKA